MNTRVVTCPICQNPMQVFNQTYDHEVQCPTCFNPINIPATNPGAQPSYSGHSQAPHNPGHQPASYPPPKPQPHSAHPHAHAHQGSGSSGVLLKVGLGVAVLLMLFVVAGVGIYLIASRDVDVVAEGNDKEGPLVRAEDSGAFNSGSSFTPKPSRTSNRSARTQSSDGSSKPSRPSKPSRSSIFSRKSSNKFEEDPKPYKQHISCTIGDFDWSLGDVILVEGQEETFVIAATLKHATSYRCSDGVEVAKTDALRKLQRITAMAAAPNGTSIVVGGVWGDIVIFGFEEDGTFGEQSKFTGHDSRIESIVVMPDNKTVASINSRGRMRVWDLETKEEKHSLSGFGSTVNAVGYDVESDEILVCGKDHFYRVDPESGETNLKAQLGSVSSASFSNDGKLLALENRSKIRVIDLSNMNEQYEVEASIFTKSLRFSSDNRMLMWVGFKNATAWEMKRNKFYTFKAASNHGSEMVRFSPNGGFTAIAPKASSGDLVILKTPAKGKWWDK